MGYIGNEPTTGHFPVQTNLVGPGPTYTLDRAPATAGAIEVSVQGVLQPTTAYSVSGTTLTMAGVASGIPLFIRYLGETIIVPTIADGVVTTAKIGADAVDGTKIADNAINSEHYTDGSIDLVHLQTGTDGELITWDASGNPAVVAVGTATHVLTSGGTGVAPTFAAAAGGGLTRTAEVSMSGQGQTIGSIPSGTSLIFVCLKQCSINGTNNYQIQVGDSGGLEVSGFIDDTSVSVQGSGTIHGVSAGGAHPIPGNDASGSVTGVVMMVLKDSTTNTWQFSHSLVTRGYNQYRAAMGGSSKSLSGELTQIRLDCNGTNTYDAGTMSLAYL